eukprot:CAMPEP_0119309926 /NCGR_PEP_ID=MMETSP1333-20130426/17595_1 /TAXON_ID=418940 /ORGANISM="Scyphosphaera apsteinii, Strain RCC1455" /LENGTH=54 /DNA_ID=CAMNT_0007314011 /DNA_START=592 /DNA_END=756 /DNA_ORIENTATION=+
MTGRASAFSMASAALKPVSSGVPAELDSTTTWPSPNTDLASSRAAAKRGSTTMA